MNDEDLFESFLSNANCWSLSQIFCFFLLFFLSIRIRVICFSLMIRMLLGDFQPLPIEGLSNDRLAYRQPGVKTWTEIDPHHHINAEFPSHSAASETFINILMHG
jgi:hypothetical protein